MWRNYYGTVSKPNMRKGKESNDRYLGTGRALPCIPGLEYTTGGQGVHMIHGTRLYMTLRNQTHEIVVSGHQHTAQWWRNKIKYTHERRLMTASETFYHPRNRTMSLPAFLGSSEYSSSRLRSRVSMQDIRRRSPRTHHKALPDEAGASTGRHQSAALSLATGT
jgi:hypothetical protein